MPGRPYYTQEQLDFLREQLRHRSHRDTCAEFDRRFGQSLSLKSLSYLVQAHDLPRRTGNEHGYTKDQIDFLRQQLPHRGHREICADFELRFDRSLSVKSLVNLIQWHDLPRRTEQVKFKPGNRSGVRRKPLYSERVQHDSRGSNLLIKLPGPSRAPSKKGNTTHWKRKAVWVWERANGPVPKGHFIVHADGDWRNCELDNLVCLDGRALGHLYIAGHAIPPIGDKDLDAARIKLAQVRARVSERAEELA